MKKYLIIFLLVPLYIYGQEMPQIHFNHVYCVIDPADFLAISGSDFVNDTLCARFTKPDSSGTYLFGPSSFLELLKARKEKYLGFSGIALSVDKIGELKILQNILSKTKKPENTIDVQDLPPFYSLSVVSDSAFHANSRIYLWFMEYKSEYFKQNNFRISDSLLTRENFLKKYSASGAGKLLKRFTGVVIRLDSSEKEYLTDIFESIGYDKTNKNQFITPDGFRFIIKERLPDDRKAIESLEFEIRVNYREKTTYRISDNILVILDGNRGKIVLE